MRVGICTFSDGRERAAEATRWECLGFQRRIADWFRDEGHTVIEAQDVVWDLDTIRGAADRLEAAHAAIGDHVAALVALCEQVGVEPLVLR
ncbi:MAG: hypothetical protein ACM3RP_06265 [Chitinophagales bacterium]